MSRSYYIYVEKKQDDEWQAIMQGAWNPNYDEGNPFCFCSIPFGKGEVLSSLERTFESDDVSSDLLRSLESLNDFWDIPEPRGYFLPEDLDANKIDRNLLGENFFKALDVFYENSGKSDLRFLYYIW